MLSLETAYQLELAVGASHVSSMLSSASRGTCIDELTASFVDKHGRTDLARFLAKLAERLDARENKEGAVAVRHFAEFGVSAVPPLTATSVGKLKKAKCARTSRVLPSR